MTRRTLLEKHQARLSVETLEDRVVPAVGMNPALNVSGIGMNPALNVSKVGMQPTVATNIAGGPAGVNLAKQPPVTTAMVGMQPTVATNIAGGPAGVNLATAPPTNTAMVGMQPTVATNLAGGAAGTSLATAPPKTTGIVGMQPTVATNIGGQANKTGMVGMQPTPQSLAVNQAVNNFYSGTGSYADFLASLGVGAKPSTTLTPPVNPNSNPFFQSTAAQQQLTDTGKAIFASNGQNVTTVGQMYAKGVTSLGPQNEDGTYNGSGPTINTDGNPTALVSSSNLTVASYAGPMLAGTGEPPPMKMIGAIELGDSPEKVAANAPKAGKKEGATAKQDGTGEPPPGSGNVLGGINSNPSLASNQYSDTAVGSVIDLTDVQAQDGDLIGNLLEGALNYRDKAVNLIQDGVVTSRTLLANVKDAANQAKENWLRTVGDNPLTRAQAEFLFKTGTQGLDVVDGGLGTVGSLMDFGKGLGYMSHYGVINTLFNVEGPELMDKAWSDVSIAAQLVLAALGTATPKASTPVAPNVKAPPGVSTPSIAPATTKAPPISAGAQVKVPPVSKMDPIKPGTPSYPVKPVTPTHPSKPNTPDYWREPNTNPVDIVDIDWGKFKDGASDVANQFKNIFTPLKPAFGR